MIYQCLYPVEKGNSGLTFQYAGLSESGRIIEEPWDHGMKHIGTSKHIDVLSHSTGLYPKLEQMEDLTVAIYMSDSRIAFFCEKYDKGSLYGGGAVGLIMTGVSKANARARSRGKALTGHIRYEWLSGLSFKRKRSLLTEDTITFYYSDTDGVSWSIHFSFPKGTDSDRMAHAIIQKACLYKHAMPDTKTHEEAELLSGYCQGKKNRPEHAR